MTSVIIITLCSLLLVAYLFDITSPKTKIPTVILLLILGWLARQATNFFQFQIPDLSLILPILGTIGLILIVLEGSLELELNRSKARLISKSFFGGLVPMLIMAFSLAGLFQYYGNVSFRDALTNAIPFCVISSAIAIPSARNLSLSNREFVIYESSFSDIFGVLLFNFVAQNDEYNFSSFGHFGLEMVSIIVISLLATAMLSFLLSRIEHHIKFFPIILIIILIYDVLKVYHLPGLVFILLFGLAIGNLDELKRFKLIQKLEPEKLNLEVQKFKELTIEATFLVRSLFFLLFGFLLETAEIFNPATFVWAIGITAGVFLLRVVQLKLSRLPIRPLIFVAPRGLITILLFLSIDISQQISLVNKSLVVQVVLLTAIVMMVGLMSARKKPRTPLSP